MELNAQNVEEVFMDCLLDDALGDKAKLVASDVDRSEVAEKLKSIGVIVAEGIVTSVGFDEEKINKRKDDIQSMINHLKPDFKEGYSFIMVAFRSDGGQWGEQRNAELLYLLGNAAGLARILMPRVMWPTLPGGVPYMQFDINKEVEE